MKNSPRCCGARLGAMLFPLIILSVISGADLTFRVTDAGSNQSISLVNVMWSGTSFGTTSDSDGLLTVPVQPGDTLLLSHIAYADLEFQVPPDTKGIISISMTPQLLFGEMVFVDATRGRTGDTPAAFTTLGHSELNKAASVEDVPMRLAQVPGVYSFSDAGNGVGYTYLKIRGFEQDRIGIMINGIPLNDPESHQVYWVDHGDILAGSGSVQVQRGVGNSLYGTAAFGGSVNLVTSPRAIPGGLTLQSGYGDFTDGAFSSPSRKLSAQWAGAPWPGQAVTVYGRYSGIRSDGYRLGSGTQQDALHLIVEALQPESSLKVEVLSGTEVTHFSWDGIIPLYGYDLNDREQRRYNYYADPGYNGGRRDANKDVFLQNIASLQYARKLNGGILALSVYGVNGRGYYEQFKGSRSPVEYNLIPVLPDTVEAVDLIRRKWLKNGYWGVIPQYTARWSRGLAVIGGEWRSYRADHYGLVRSVDVYSIDADRKYYGYLTDKETLSAYIHNLIELSPALKFMLDLKYTRHYYTFEQEPLGAYVDPYEYQLTYQFLDPRLGLRYTINPAFATFISLSRAQREPADSDIYDADDPEADPWLEGAPGLRQGLTTPLVEPERLWDLELGWIYDAPGMNVTTNLYYMWFSNELIPMDYRTIAEDGVPLHGNADLTVHRGLELQFTRKIGRGISIDGSFTFADNRFIKYATFEWQEDSVINHRDKQIPGHPRSMGWLRLDYAGPRLSVWTSARHVGPLQIDRQNTSAARIDPSTVISVGTVYGVALPAKIPLGQLELSLTVNNLFDTLYETFGYNYWDWDDAPYRVDVYWPGATRGYFAALSLALP